MQKDLFRQDDICELIQKCESVKKTAENVRKGLFARHSQLQRMFEELCSRFDEQEREIYKLKIALYGERESVIFPIQAINAL